MDVRAMCAIGRRGQLGLRGRLPWEGAPPPSPGPMSRGSGR